MGPDSARRGVDRTGRCCGAAVARLAYRRSGERRDGEPEQGGQGESDEEDALIRSRYLPEEPPWLRRLKWFPAKGLRVALKIARQAYW